MAIEIDTDVKGVEVLMRGDGLTEREAFYNSKGGRTVMRGGTPSWVSRPGHGSACDELLTPTGQVSVPLGHFER